MSAAIWITKFLVSFLSLVVLDKLWTLLKTSISNRRTIKTAA